MMNTPFTREDAIEALKVSLGDDMHFREELAKEWGIDFKDVFSVYPNQPEIRKASEEERARARDRAIDLVRRCPWQKKVLRKIG